MFSTLRMYARLAAMRGHGAPRIGNNAHESIRVAYKYWMLNNR